MTSHLPTSCDTARWIFSLLSFNWNWLGRLSSNLPTSVRLLRLLVVRCNIFTPLPVKWHGYMISLKVLKVDVGRTRNGKMWNLGLFQSVACVGCAANLESLIWTNQVWRESTVFKNHTMPHCNIQHRPHLNTTNKSRPNIGSSVYGGRHLGVRLPGAVLTQISGDQWVSQSNVDPDQWVSQIYQPNYWR